MTPRTIGPKHGPVAAGVFTEAGRFVNTVFLPYFNAGPRAVDITDALRPFEIGHYLPACPAGQPAIRSNDIGMDERGQLCLIDRGARVCTSSNRLARRAG